MNARRSAGAAASARAGARRLRCARAPRRRRRDPRGRDAGARRRRVARPRSAPDPRMRSSERKQRGLWKHSAERRSRREEEEYECSRLQRQAGRQAGAHMTHAARFNVDPTTSTRREEGAASHPPPPHPLAYYDGPDGSERAWCGLVWSGPSRPVKADRRGGPPTHPSSAARTGREKEDPGRPAGLDLWGLCSEPAEPNRASSSSTSKCSCGGGPPTEVKGPCRPSVPRTAPPPTPRHIGNSAARTRAPPSFRTTTKPVRHHAAAATLAAAAVLSRWSCGLGLSRRPIPGGLPA
jgi:hypothetical protein